VDNQVFLVTLNTLGMAVLSETLKEAYYYISHTSKLNGHVNRSVRMAMSNGAESFAYVNGTGLNVLINYYHLDLRPDEVKFSFLKMVRMNSADYGREYLRW